VYDGIPYHVKQRTGDWVITAENMEKSQHTAFNEDTTNESASVACSKNEETRLDDAFGVRNIQWVSWMAKKTSGFLTKLDNEGTDRHRQSKEASILGSCLEKEIMQGTVPDACKQGRPRKN